MQGGVDLTWTAVGDDGSVGNAASYDLRYSTSPITPVNWASATSFPQAWTAVTDLAASAGPNYGEIQLTWTATGDDGNSGTATSYLVKVDTSPIDSTNFGAAPLYVQSWTPSVAGTTENQVLTGLGFGQTYCIALKVLDDVANPSAISNVVTCTTTTPMAPEPSSRVLN